MDRDHPAHPTVGVGVVVWKAGCVLLVRRGKPPMAGRWSLPGGRQELGETTREAAQREVAEETGLAVALGRLLDVVDIIRRDASGLIELQYALIDYEADWTAGEAVAGDDAVEVAWADPADLDAYELWSETARVIRLSADGREAEAREKAG